MSRVLRSYDAAGRVSEEKQIVEDPLAMFPADLRVRIQQSSDSAVAEVRKQITALMGGHQGFSSVIYTYDDKCRLKETLRQTFNREDSIVITYNEHGDEASTRTVRAGGTAEQSVSPTNSEERCSYEYDAHGNWTQKIITTLGTDGSIAYHTQSSSHPHLLLRGGRCPFQARIASGGRFSRGVIQIPSLITNRLVSTYQRLQ